MRRRQLRSAIAIALSIVMASAMIPEFAFAEEVLVTEDNVTEADVSEKTETTTTYELSNGENMTVFHSDDVRFKDENGVLTDYDPTLVRIQNGAGSSVDLSEYAYENREGDSAQYLPESLSEETPVVMEKDDDRVSMSMTEDALFSLGITGSVSVKKDLVETAYEEEKEKRVDAVYTGETADITYRSENKGIKETITLYEKPESGIFTYVLDLKGMIPVIDRAGGISFFDEDDPDEIKGGISSAFMNDAGGKAYSEDIEYLLEETEGKGRYLLTMEVSEEYLMDPGRAYPVTIDPSVSWTGSSKVKDAYVISGSKYGNSNFYSSTIKKMPVGYNSTGKHRTYIQFTGLASALRDKYITGASLDVYDYGEGTANQNIYVRKLTSSWSPSKVTWKSRPSHSGTILDTITVKKVAHRKYSFDVTAYAEGLSSGKADYGLGITHDATKYVSFYGSRASSYKPKLTVTYRLK